MTISASARNADAASGFAPARIPPRAGAGLKPAHVDAILGDDYRIGFLEVHAENYMGDGGAPHRALTAIRQQFPLSRPRRRPLDRQRKGS